VNSRSCAEAKPNWLAVVGAQLARRAASRAVLHSRKQEANQHTNNRDHNQQFDERETTLLNRRETLS
jgi:hypothetical protein